MQSQAPTSVSADHGERFHLALQLSMQLSCRSLHFVSSGLNLIQTATAAPTTGTNSRLMNMQPGRR